MSKISEIIFFKNKNIDRFKGFFLVFIFSCHDVGAFLHFPLGP